MKSLSGCCPSLGLMIVPTTTEFLWNRIVSVFIQKSRKTLTPEAIDRIRRTCTTQPELVVAYLWFVEDWTPTHELRGRDTPFGWIGSAGDVRARELARNAQEIDEKLHNKIERARGAAISKEPAQCEFFRYKPATSLPLPEHGKVTREEAERVGRENCEMFDAS